MCISPIKIKNPNLYKGAALGGVAPSDFFRLTHDTISEYINVPCGQCTECRFVRQSGYYQRMLEMSRNNYVYFGTLTYNENILNVEYKDTIYTCAPYDDFQKMIKRLRKRSAFFRDFSYFCVREYGKKKGRAHIHCLIFIPKKSSDTYFTPYHFEDVISTNLFQEWRRNVGSTRNPVYLPLTTYREKHLGGKLFKNYDLHYVQSRNFSDESNVYFYITKYLLKDNKFINRLRAQINEDEELSREDRNELRRILLRNSWASSHFGLPFFSQEDKDDKQTRERIGAMILRSVENDSPFPQYFSDNGEVFPLSRYYRDKFMTDEQKLIFCQRISSDSQNFVVLNNRSTQDIMRGYVSGQRVMDMQNDFDSIDFLEDDD